MRKRFWVASILVVLVPFLPRIVAALRPVPPDPRVLPDSAVNLQETYSNILPEDYVGPEACAQCHRKKFDQWSRHSHSRMNQLPSKDTVLGDFSGTVLKLTNASVTFSTEGGNYLMSVERSGQLLRRYRVTRTVGTHYQQFYIGVQVEGPEPPDHPLYREHMLPFAYWRSLGRWLPKHYFDSDGAEELRDGIPQVEGIDHIRDVRPYNQVCMNCHNTYAYSYRVFHPMYAGFPNATVAVTTGPLSAALSPRVSVEPTVDSFTSLNGRLDPDRHLVTLGISCESCHFGGREHAVNGEHIRFAPTSPFLRISPHDPDRPVLGKRKDPASITGICAQCHSGNARLLPNGAGQWNSREALDFVKGACTSQLHCASCHDPHTGGKLLGDPTSPGHEDLCVRCHEQYRAPDAAAAHAHHPVGAQVSCMDCHMPRQTQGIEDLVRTHRITMPVEESMAARDSVNACNLCHLDKPLSWTLRELEQGWGRRLEPRPDWASAGRPDAPMGEVWLKGNDTGMRLVATGSYARSPLGRAMLPDILRALNDPEPINRVFAFRAVERIRGRKLESSAYEVTAPPDVRARQIEQLLTEVGHWSLPSNGPTEPKSGGQPREEGDGRRRSEVPHPGAGGSAVGRAGGGSRASRVPGRS